MPFMMQVKVKRREYPSREYPTITSQLQVNYKSITSQLQVNYKSITSQWCVLMLYIQNKAIYLKQISDLPQKVKYFSRVVALNNVLVPIFPDSPSQKLIFQQTSVDTWSPPLHGTCGVLRSRWRSTWIGVKRSRPCSERCSLLLKRCWSCTVGWALLGVKIETSMNLLATFHKVGPGRGEHDGEKVFGSDH